MFACAKMWGRVRDILADYLIFSDENSDGIPNENEISAVVYIVYIYIYLVYTTQVNSTFRAL